MSPAVRLVPQSRKLESGAAASLGCGEMHPVRRMRGGLSAGSGGGERPREPGAMPFLRRLRPGVPGGSAPAFGKGDEPGGDCGNGEKGFDVL